MPRFQGLSTKTSEGGNEALNLLRIPNPSVALHEHLDTVSSIVADHRGERHMRNPPDGLKRICRFAEDDVEESTSSTRLEHPLNAQSMPAFQEDPLSGFPRHSLFSSHSSSTAPLRISFSDSLFSGNTFPWRGFLHL